MITKYQAVQKFVFVIRDEKIEESGGIYIPDQAQKKPNTGTIISVGELVEDKSIRVGMKAIFHKAVGQEIVMPEVTFIVLFADPANPQLLGVYESTE
jgi:co-chaperonin GroES (HSP10)